MNQHYQQDSDNDKGGTLSFGHGTIIPQRESSPSIQWNKQV